MTKDRNTANLKLPPYSDLLRSAAHQYVKDLERIKKKPHSSRYLPTIRASRELSSPSKIGLVAEEPRWRLWLLEKSKICHGDTSSTTLIRSSKNNRS